MNWPESYMEGYDDAIIELLNMSLAFEVPVGDLFNYLADKLTRDSYLIAEAKIYSYIMRCFGRRFRYTGKTPDFISVDKKIAVEAKSVKHWGKGVSLKKMVRYWYVPYGRYGHRKAYRFMRLHRMHEKGTEVYIVIYIRSDGAFRMYSWPDVLDVVKPEWLKAIYREFQWGYEHRKIMREKRIRVFTEKCLSRKGREVEV